MIFRFLVFIRRDIRCFVQVRDYILTGEHEWILPNYPSYDHFPYLGTPRRKKTEQKEVWKERRMEGRKGGRERVVNSKSSVF